MEDFKTQQSDNTGQIAQVVRRSHLVREVVSNDLSEYNEDLIFFFFLAER